MKNNWIVISKIARGMIAGALFLNGTSLIPLSSDAKSLVAHAAETTATTDTMSTFKEKSEDIRVALFANLSKASPGVTPQVTMSAPAKLQITALHNSEPIGTVDAEAKQIGFSADDYKVKWIETNDKAIAIAVLKQAQPNESAVMIVLPRRGTDFYAVYVGSYPTEEAAKEALLRLKQENSRASLLPPGYEPTIVGPHYVQTGTYASPTEAVAVRNRLLDINVDAFIVSTLSDGQLRTSVWVGHVDSEAKLEQMQMIVKQKKIPLYPLQTQGAIVHVKEETDKESLVHFRVHGMGKWVVQPIEAAQIQILERFQRIYRGKMEISLYNGMLALVNEVPLKPYLNSVVGGEVYSHWPSEALKAQAVAARTLVLYPRTKFVIANVVDTALSQAYKGVDKEHPNIEQAVADTDGEVLMQGGKLINAIYSSNAGGKTADASELWGQSYSYYQVADSPDEGVKEGKKSWVHVVMADGQHGYVRENMVEMTDQPNEAGLNLASVSQDGTNIRAQPVIQTDVHPVAKVNKGTMLAAIETVPELTDFDWVRGPYTSEHLTNLLKNRTKTALQARVTSLQITERGPSGRVVKMEANGVPVAIPYPDNFRYALGGLPSTLFDIVSRGTNSEPIVDRVGTGPSEANRKQTVSNRDSYGGNVSQNSSAPTFLFIGKGNGHGVGLSQWGAKGWADQGYDYKKILQHYYKDVQVVKYRADS